MRFQIGDIVRISKVSGWYGTSEDNPKDIEGVIEELPCIKVIWDNSTYNFYEEHDLRLVRRPDASNG